MVYPSYLLPAIGKERLEAQFAAARMLASGTPHHLMALFVTEPPPVASPTEMTWSTDMQDAFSTTQKELRVTLGTCFEGLCQRTGVALVKKEAADTPSASACFYDVNGLRDIATGEFARQADIVVLSTDEEGLGHPYRMVAEAVLSRSGRPLLLVPPAGFSHLPKKALIAWNGRAEAARAVALAMPLLKAVGHAHVLTIGDVPKGSPDAAAMGAYLSRHGVVTSHATLEKTSEDISDRLAAEGARIGAELMVMGAYSHSRWRELVLGGVTQDILEKPVMATLIAH